MRRLIAAFLAFLVAPPILFAAPRVCAPDAMLKVSVARDGPDLPSNDFGKVPKVIYRSGTAYGRVEETLNPQTELYLLIVVSEPHFWIADLASGRGSYERDAGPTYYFRALVFGDPNIRSSFINSLEFGCEENWLLAEGAIESNVEHPLLGGVRKLTYREGAETLHMYLRNGVPLRLEIFQNGALYGAIRYLEYRRGLRFDNKLFERPPGIEFAVPQGVEGGT